MSQLEKNNILVLETANTVAEYCSDQNCGIYQLESVRDLDAAFACLEKNTPIIILIETGKLEFDGLAACKTLSRDAKTQNIPIMLLASDSGLENEIEAYLAGAYDYLEQPIDPAKLLHKLDFFRKHRSLTQQLTVEAKNAADTALSLMVGNNELGQAIRFVERSYAVIDYQSLADAFLSVTDNLGLKCGLYFNSNTGPMFYGSGGVISPIESDLLLRLHDTADRIMDFSNRTIFRYPRISLIVKNMPLDDMEKYGRIKDLMPSMLGAADARVGSLDTEAALVKQTNDVRESYQLVRETLQNLAANFTNNQQKTLNTMQDMLNELDYRLPSMGLEEDQESYLIGRVDAAVSEAATINNNGEELNHAFQSISVLLDHLAKQQDHILEIVLTRQSGEDETTPDDDDIELF